MYPLKPTASISKCDGQCALPTPDVRETFAHIVGTISAILFVNSNVKKVSLSACRDDEETNESFTKVWHPRNLAGWY